MIGSQTEIETTERRLAELTAERNPLDSEWINAEDVKPTLVEVDSRPFMITLTLIVNSKKEHLFARYADRGGARHRADIRPLRFDRDLSMQSVRHARP